MASGNSSPGSRQAEKGCLGTRLGEPYIYRWMDQEPTKQTWADLANQRGCLGAFIGVVAVVLVCTLVAGIQGFILGFLFLSGFGALAGLFYRQLGGRTDGGPVPKPVWREAYIEYAWGEFYFVLEVDGKPEIWQPLAPRAPVRESRFLADVRGRWSLSLQDGLACHCHDTAGRQTVDDWEYDRS